MPWKAFFLYTFEFRERADQQILKGSLREDSSERVGFLHGGGECGTFWEGVNVGCFHPCWCEGLCLHMLKVIEIAFSAHCHAVSGNLRILYNLTLWHLKPQ